LSSQRQPDICPAVILKLLQTPVIQSQVALYLPAVSQYDHWPFRFV